MIATDEDALICDFAEYYHIYDYQALPVKYVATLAFGLRENSRIKIKLSESNVGIDTMLLASIVDKLALLLWSKTVDGEKNQNRPKSIIAVLQGTNEVDSTETEFFNSGNDFEKEWEKITGNKRLQGGE